MADVADDGAEVPDDSGLPSDLPEDKMSDLIERLSDAARKIGLYFVGAAVQEDTSPEEELEGAPRHHRLMVQFSVGDLAFSTRVQDPEAEKINDRFREITASSVDDDMEAIRERYRKPKAS